MNVMKFTETGTLWLACGLYEFYFRGDVWCWFAQAGKDQMGNDGHNLWGDFPFTKEHFKEIIPNF